MRVWNHRIDFDRAIKLAVVGIIFSCAVFVGVTTSVGGDGDKARGRASGDAPGNASPGARGAKTPGSGKNGGAEPSAVTVTAVTLAPRAIRKTIKLSGDVTSRSRVSVYPDTAGKVVRYEVAVGSSVRKGAVIARVDPSRPGSPYAENPVRSPIDGTVISLPYARGGTVAASSEIAVVGRLDDLEIVVDVPERYAGVLKPGLPASVRFVAYPDDVFSATVSRVSPVVDPSTRTVETRLGIERGNGKARPGMFADVSLVAEERAGVLGVPKAAVRSYNGEPVVYVVGPEGKAERRAVGVGLMTDADTELVSGVGAGETVVVSGSVSAGTPVRVAEGE